MPALLAAPWFAPVVTAGASAATSIFGAKKAAGASKDAAKTQADASGRAEADSRRATADALRYIEGMRTGGPSYAPGSTQGYLSTLLGVPQRSPMLAGTGAAPMGQPGQMPGRPGPVDYYAQLYGAPEGRAVRRGVR